jgi:hypothetical protein
MSIPITVDKAETEDTPVESAIAEFVLCGDLACRIRELGIGLVIFEAGMGRIRIVNQSGACHDEASLWSVVFRSGDQVFRAIEIGSPDVILILSPENRGEMNDCRNVLHGLFQRIRIEQIAFYRCRSSGKFLAPPYKRTAVHAGIDEPSQKPRTHKSRSTGN